MIATRRETAKAMVEAGFMLKANAGRYSDQLLLETKYAQLILLVKQHC